MPRLHWRPLDDSPGYCASAGVFNLRVWPEGKKWAGAVPAEGLVAHGLGDYEAAEEEAERMAEEAALGVLKALRGARQALTSSTTTPG